MRQLTHKELLEEIDKRLQKTDEKIDATAVKVDEVKEELHKYNIKTAVLEAQMSGVVKFTLLVIGSGIGIISYIIKQGI